MKKIISILVAVFTAILFLECGGKDSACAAMAKNLEKLMKSDPDYKEFVEKYPDKVKSIIEDNRKNCLDKYDEKKVDCQVNVKTFSEFGLCKNK